MAKRFTDTDKYRSPFIRGLQGAYKLLWDYLYHECNHAGIWIVDFDIAQIYIGKDMPVDKETALKYYNKGKQRIIEFDNGSRWFIPSFIEHQYKNNLNPENRVHASVILELKKYNLYEIYIKGLISPSKGCKDKDKDKDTVKAKDKDKDKDTKLHNNIKAAFESKYGDFDDYPKEGQSINHLIEKAKSKAPNCSDDFIQAVLETFWQLKQNGNAFWKDQPFLPSILNSSGIWPRVLENMRKKEIPEPEEIEF